MKKTAIPFSRTSIPSLVQDKVDGDPKVRELEAFPSTEQGYSDAIEKRKEWDVDRKILVDSLLMQYDQAGIEEDDSPTFANIHSLKKKNTFTITTGHQLCLFTGPLFFIYKVLHTIVLAEHLKKKHPEDDFVPVYWMASEDHDLPEIDHTFINGNRVRWSTGQTGPVGRMHTGDMEKAISSLEKELGDSIHANELMEAVRKSYGGSDTLANATRKFIHSFLSKFGLVVIDGDEKNLKRQFIPDMKKELFEESTCQATETMIQKFRENQYHVQVNPREINLFYINDGQRDRIIRKGEGFKVLNNGKEWTEESLQKELEEEPQRFSPNVLTRPIYQERVLPNITYIGGPGEISYWLQLKGAFDTFGAFFPVLQLRNSVYWLDDKTCRNIQKTRISPEELFQDTDLLIKEAVKGASHKDLDLEEEEKSLEQFYKELAEKAAKVNSDLESSVMAEHRKSQKGLERIRKKMIRDEKRNQEILVRRIREIKEVLFPGGTPQERVENFSTLFITHGEDLFDILAEHFDPIPLGPMILTEEPINA